MCPLSSRGGGGGGKAFFAASLTHSSYPSIWHIFYFNSFNYKMSFSYIIELKLYACVSLTLLYDNSLGYIMDSLSLGIKKEKNVNQEIIIRDLLISPNTKIYFLSERRSFPSTSSSNPSLSTLIIQSRQVKKSFLNSMFRK